jgi:V8-like Glu-specific endopeptidase
MMATIGVAAGADALRPGIIGTDDRIILAAEGPPWDAIGQVNTAGFRSAGQCTGTLVGPGVVITAAHCVTNPATGRAFPAGDIHFLAAVRGSGYKGHATARCVRFLDGGATPRTRMPAKPTLADLAVDAAVIVLDGPAGVEPALLATGATAATGPSLTHVAYPGDRRFAPVVHRNCSLLGTAGDGALWFNDCDTHPGSSGGPVLVEEAGTYKLAAIQVAAGSGSANVALALPAWAGLVAAVGCP